MALLKRIHQNKPCCNFGSKISTEIICMIDTQNYKYQERFLIKLCASKYPTNSSMTVCPLDSSKRKRKQFCHGTNLEIIGPKKVNCSLTHSKTYCAKPFILVSVSANWEYSWWLMDLIVVLWAEVRQYSLIINFVKSSRILNTYVGKENATNGGFA